MGIGVGIFLIAFGAILTFAVNLTIGGLDLDVVGWILMIVGVGGLILFFYFWNRRRVPEAVEAIRQPQIRSRPPTYDDRTPPQPATVTTVTAAAPVAPPPEEVTAVIATASVPAASQGRPDRH